MNSEFQSINLEEVTKSDCKFLYELLKNRHPCTNISHKKLPTYDEHVRFVMSKPYKKWYIIKLKNQKIGSIYLSSQDEIGMFMEKKFQRKRIGKKSVEILMKKNPRTRYLTNVAPKNIPTQKFFEKLGFTCIEYTYEFTKPFEKK